VPRPSKVRVVSFKEVGERVRAIRLANELTQAELAKKLGTTQTALSEIERGNRGISLQQVVKLSRALKSTPNDLLGEGKNGGAPPLTNARLLRRLRRIETLPHAQQEAVLKVIDSVIGATHPQ